MGEREGSRPIELVLARILFFLGFVVVLREKLPRFFTARSTTALVVPVNLLCHAGEATMVIAKREGSD